MTQDNTCNGSVLVTLRVPKQLHDRLPQPSGRPLGRRGGRNAWILAALEAAVNRNEKPEHGLDPSPAFSAQ